jgi:hypothetical protein
MSSWLKGQQLDEYTWKTAFGWTEGVFLSPLQRVGQALRTHNRIDDLVDADEDAMIVVCGDVNADLDDVPVEAIRGGRGEYRQRQAGQTRLGALRAKPSPSPRVSRGYTLVRGGCETICSSRRRRSHVTEALRSTTSCYTMNRLSLPATSSTRNPTTHRLSQSFSCPGQMRVARTMGGENHAQLLR